MRTLPDGQRLSERAVPARIPVSILVPVRNEAANLPRTLASVAWADEIVVIDSHSTDGTVQVARDHGADVLQFTYTGGWPKKRQWALDSYPFRNDWILLLDADEVVPEALAREIAVAIANVGVAGYYVPLDIVFWGRRLRYGDTRLWKLSLFRRGTGRYERRLLDQDPSMADIEVHEHVVVTGAVGRLSVALVHENRNSLARYIEKHNEYSNWEARVWVDGVRDGEIVVGLAGSQAARRRWIKQRFIRNWWFCIGVFVYKYLLRRGFLDGIPGLVYSAFQAIQVFHVRAKIEELQRSRVR